MIRFALCVVLASLCTGCFLSRETDNEPVPPELLARLAPGVTTASQAVELLGAPTDIVQLGRRSAYLYSQSTAKRAGLFLGALTRLRGAGAPIQRLPHR